MIAQGLSHISCTPQPQCTHQKASKLRRHQRCRLLYKPLVDSWGQHARQPHSHCRPVTVCCAKRQEEEQSNQGPGTTTFLVTAGALTVLAGAALTVWQEPIADWIFYESISDSGGGFGPGDIVGALLWGCSLWYCSPLQLLLLFLGEIDVERPSDWVMMQLGKLTGQPIDKVDYCVPTSLRLATAGLCLMAGFGIAAAFNWGLGDATWSISTGFLALVSAGVYEVGRPRRLSVDEAQTLEAQWKDFESFAVQRLQKVGRCHESEVFDAFRKSFAKYRSPSTISDDVLRDMVRYYNPGVERTARGYYKNLSLTRKVDGFTGQATGTALPTTAPGEMLNPQELLQGNSAPTNQILSSQSANSIETSVEAPSKQ